MMPPAEKRQRVSRACDECKRKKKQCTGKHPCGTCTQKSLLCIFSSIPPSLDTQRARSRRATHQSIEVSHHANIDIVSVSGGDEPPKDSTNEDETPIQNPGRLLQDGEGRLLYLGDSATLSFLQGVRRLVESTLGSSPFTLDSSRHRILEASISTPQPYQHNYALPDLEAAQYLVNSFFANTAGLVDIFNKETFKAKLAETYKYPLEADPEWLCQLNLVFAIGLRMRKGNPASQSAEYRVLDRLEGGRVNRAEVFFLAAKLLKDPVAGIEDGGISVVQSLLLMTIYMLASSKRNTAWSYMGMAVTLAYALGIHKDETLSTFSSSEQAARRNLWQSLYVMDCFLAAMMGRPNAISCASASEFSPFTPVHRSSGAAPRGSNELLIPVNASKVIGEILSRIYHKRKASRSIAYFLSLRFNDWVKKLPDELHWKQILLDDGDPDLTLKRLHINLIYFSGIILLTRPFLLYEVSKGVQELAEGTTAWAPKPPNFASQNESRKPEQLFCFHGACVRSAMNTISTTHAAFLSGALPRRDPFVIYWLFSAALIILTNIFCPVYCELEGEAAVLKALKVIRYCGEAEPQARRYQTILESFHDVLQAEKKSKQATQQVQEERNIFNMLFGNDGVPGGLDESLAINPTVNGVSQNWVPSTSGDASGEGPMPGLEALYYAATASGQVTGMTPWFDQMAGLPNDSMEFDGMWWSGGQDNFMAAGEAQVPLYGLMEPT